MRLKRFVLWVLIFVCVTGGADSPLPLRVAEAAEPFSFKEMYKGASSLGIVLSDRIKALNGQNIVMERRMAPPLKPTLNFFVLTRVPMSICPFCSTDADWPYDIVVVYLKRNAPALPFDRPIRVTGRLELGTSTDAETGFVSLVRLYADSVGEAKQ